MPIHLSSRRMFLKGALGAGAGVVLGGCDAGRRRDESPKSPPVDTATWALLADTHINESLDKVERGGKMGDRFDRVVRDVLATEVPLSGLVVAGDIAHQIGRKGAYASMLKLSSPLRQAGIEMHLALGNHDNRDHFLEVVHRHHSPVEMVANRYLSVVDSGPVRCFLLDSLIRPNHIPGRLGDDQIRWLAHALDAMPDKPALLFLHHNLDDPGGGLQDADALMKVITPRRQVKAVFQGHNHLVLFQEVDGIHLVKLPATGYVFDKAQPIGWLLARFTARSGSVEVRAVDGDRSQHGQVRSLAWRSA